MKSVMVEERGEGDLAVLCFPPAQRRCEPVFFEREQGICKIDFAFMQNELGHNHHNYWYFVQGVPPAVYAFAFKGWAFVTKGFSVSN